MAQFKIGDIVVCTKNRKGEHDLDLNIQHIITTSQLGSQTLGDDAGGVFYINYLKGKSYRSDRFELAILRPAEIPLNIIIHFKNTTHEKDKATERISEVQERSKRAFRHGAYGRKHRR